MLVRGIEAVWTWQLKEEVNAFIVVYTLNRDIAVRRLRSRKSASKRCLESFYRRPIGSITVDGWSGRDRNTGNGFNGRAAGDRINQRATCAMSTARVPYGAHGYIAIFTYQTDNACRMRRVLAAAIKKALLAMIMMVHFCSPSSLLSSVPRKKCFMRR